MGENDEIPQSVLDEVNRIRGEGGDDNAPAEDNEPERVQAPRGMSRREAKELERQEREKKFLEAAESSKRALEAIEEMRRQRQEDQERYARLEGMLGTIAQQRQSVQGEPTKPDTDDESPQEKYLKHMKKAKEALAAQDLDTYHDRLAKAQLALARAEMAKRIPQQTAQPQQQFQKPPWVSAVEAQFPDVMMHPSGLNTVAAFAQMDPTALSPEKLQKAFTRARSELGLGKKEESNSEKRQRLAGSSTTTSKKPASSEGEPDTVEVPKNWKEVARRAGMSEADYLRAAKAMGGRGR